MRPSAITKTRGVFVDRKEGETLTVNGVTIRVEHAGRGKVRVLCVAGQNDTIEFSQKAPVTAVVNPEASKTLRVTFKNSGSNR